MTKKHFIALAEAIKGLDMGPVHKRKVAIAIGYVCQQFNPVFNWNTWYEHCGV
jgi:hypothetical protein